LLELITWSICVFVLPKTGNFWSAAVQKKPLEDFANSGPYRFARHPHYSSFLMFIISLGINKADLVLLIPLTAQFLVLASRIVPEEKLMLELYSERYMEYRLKKGALTPCPIPLCGFDWLDGPLGNYLLADEEEDKPLEVKEKTYSV